jgi:hypothetical protein
MHHEAVLSRAMLVVLSSDFLSNERKRTSRDQFSASRNEQEQWMCSRSEQEQFWKIKEHAREHSRAKVANFMIVIWSHIFFQRLILVNKCDVSCKHQQTPTSQKISENIFRGTNIRHTSTSMSLLFQICRNPKIIVHSSTMCDLRTSQTQSARILSLKCIMSFLRMSCLDQVVFR